jgi:hypothetical protein
MLSDLFKSELENQQESNYSTNEIYANSNLIPIISKGRSYKDSRQCVRANYIPHYTPSKSDFNEWIDSYYLQLNSLYKILRDKVNEKYPKNKIKWESENIKFNFYKLIYHCSSKYIDKLV